MKRILSLGACALIATSAFAQQHEILAAGTFSGINFSRVPNFTGDTYTQTGFGLSAGYRYLLSDMLQLGSRVNVDFIKGDDTTFTSMALAVGPVFNFGGTTLADSFFAEAMFGLDRDSFTGREANTSKYVSAAIGKRFPLTESVTIAPSIGWVKYLEEGSTSNIQIALFSLTVLL